MVPKVYASSRSYLDFCVNLLDYFSTFMPKLCSGVLTRDEVFLLTSLFVTALPTQLFGAVEYTVAYWILYMY